MELALIHQNCDLCGADDAVDGGRVAVGAACHGLGERCGVALDQVRAVRCAECGFFYADPMPHLDHDALQELYSGDYLGEYTEKWRHTRMVANPERRLDAIERTAHRPVHRFLEVGCGEGFAMERAVLRGWEVAGQEVSEEFASRVQSAWEVFVGDLKDAPWRAGSFDAVYMDSVIEHVPRPVAMLRTIASLLRPGGVLCLICPNENSLFNSAKSLARRLGLRKAAAQLSPLRTPYHIVGFSRATLARALDQAGFEPVEVAARFGREELGKFVPRSLKQRLRALGLHPVYRLGEWLGRGTTLEAIALREPAPATRP